MKCPLCNGKLSADKVNKWILCDSKNHKYKLTDFDDATRKTVTLKQLSDTVVEMQKSLGEGNVDETNTALLNGQMHAYQMLAEFLRDNDWRDYEPLNPSKTT